MQEIFKLRNQIDDVDDQILSLLNTRTKFAIKIAHLKHMNKLSIETPQREKEIINRIQVNNKGPFPNIGLESIYKTVFMYTKEVQKVSLLKS